MDALLYRDIDLSTRGVVLAVASGVLTSGLGCVIWYAALGGMVFLNELVSLRFAVSAVLILGGVGLTLAGREKATDRS